MKEIILLLYFICSFMFIFGILYYFIMLDKRTERRLKYYLEIDKKYKKMKNKSEKDKLKFVNLKNVNQFVGDRLSDESQSRIEEMLRSSGVDLDAEEYIVLRFLSAASCGLISGMIFRNFFFVIPGAILGYMLPKFWTSKKRKNRIEAFNEALPDMILTIIGSLRAGYSFSQAMKTVAEECESPVKEEITMLLKEMSYGITMEDALNNLKLRMPSNDLDLMIQAILIQRQVGGNLSMILEVIVKTIRERNTIERQVQSLTAQGRLSGKVIGLLPVVLGVGLNIINPEYMKAFTSSIIGKGIMGLGILSALIGYALINKLTKIEV